MYHFKSISNPNLCLVERLPRFFTELEEYINQIPTSILDP